MLGRVTTGETMTNATMVTFETTIPDESYTVLKTRGYYRERLAADARLLLAVHYFESGTLSLGQAAELAGYDRWEFIELLSKRGVPVVDLNAEEFADELQAVEALRAQRQD